MDLEDDEDVVFQESALYNYFQEIGINSSEFEFVPKLMPHVDTNLKRSWIVYPVAAFLYVKSIWNLAFQWMFASFDLHKLNTLKENKSCCDYLKMILESNVLIEEDAHFLRHWNITEASEKKYSPCWNSISVSVIVVVMAVLVEVFNLHWPIRNDKHMILVTILAILLFASTCHSFVIWCKILSHDRHHKQNVKCLQDLLACCIAIKATMRKAINLIQELELVSKGFTFIVAGAQIPKLESQDLPLHACIQQCPALRSTIHQCATELCLNFRTATKELLNKYKLALGIDHESHYLAMVPLEDFANVLSMERLCKEPDSKSALLSVAACKSVWQLGLLQLSEFVRRFGLCLFLELHEDKTTKIFLDIDSIISPNCSKISYLAKKIDQSYNFHKSAVFNLSTISKPKKSATGENHFHDLQVAVHSLVLHLQSALNRSVALETELENLKNCLNTCDMNKNRCKEDFYAYTTSLLQSVKLEMETCQTCHEESIKKLEIHCGCEKEEVQRFPTMDMAEPTVKHSEGTPILLIEMSDPVIEDQVFEATVTKEDVSPPTEEEDDSFSCFELEKKKQEKEYSQKVLKELKSILTVKADEWRKREAQALAKCKGMKDFNIDNIETENSESDNSLAFLSRPALKIETSDSVGTTSDISKRKSDDDSFQQNDIHLVKNEMEFLKQEERIEIENRLKDLPQASNLGFVAGVAAMAAAKSQLFKSLPPQTFGDGNDEIFGSDDETSENSNSEGS